MGDEQRDKQLDTLLDSMLAGYSDVEPRPGLEGRVLSSIREASARQPSLLWKWRWVWAGAAAFAAAVAIAILLLSSPSSSRQPNAVANGTAGSENVASPRVANTAPQNVIRQHKPRKFAQARPLPKMVVTEVRRDVFPTPEPLSDQERMMLRYLSRTPHEELVAQSHVDMAPDEDLLQGPPGVFSPNSRNQGNSN